MATHSDMARKTGLDTPSHILLHAVARECDPAGVVFLPEDSHEFPTCSQRESRFVTTRYCCDLFSTCSIRKADVGEKNVELVLRGDTQRFFHAARHVHFCDMLLNKGIPIRRTKSERASEGAREIHTITKVLF